MIVGVGKVEAETLPDTAYNSDRARKFLAEQLASLIGRDFWGKSSITLVWKAGQIVEVGETIDRRVV